MDDEETVANFRSKLFEVLNEAKEAHRQRLESEAAGKELEVKAASKELEVKAADDNRKRRQPAGLMPKCKVRKSTS